MKLSERMHNREPMGIHGHQVEEWADEVAQLEIGLKKVQDDFDHFYAKSNQLEAEIQRLMEKMDNQHIYIQQLVKDLDALKEGDE